MGVAFIIAAVLSGAATTAEPTKEEESAALKAIVSCYFAQTAELDDGTSDADVIATAVVNSCSKELSAMDHLSKRKVISIANSMEGLSKHEKNKLALSLLETKPQELRKSLESRAIEVVLRARMKARKTNGAVAQ